MYYIIYLSSATQLFDNQELQDILEVSNKNNEQQGVTGLLLYSDGNIIQVLEGEKETVQAIYKKIAQDSRHHSIITLKNGELAERNFPDWSMGFKTISSKAFSEIAGFKDLRNQSFESIAPVSNHPVLNILKTFYTGNIQRF